MGKEKISPFQFGTLATRENFIDREKDRAQLKQLLLSHINVMLLSPRRWGKSSLVKMTTEELCAEHDEVRVCLIDAFSIASEAEFYRAFASKVIACASTRMERWVSDAKEFLTGVVPQVVVSDQVNDFIAFDMKYVPREQDKMTILQLPETLARKKGLHIIVCIDEFQQLAALLEYKSMIGKMRAAWQEQKHVTYCLYGSKRNMMLRIFCNARSPFYRFGQVIFMKKIAKKDWVEFIVRAFEGTGKHISAELAGRICDTVECHSWYVQQLCYFIWSITENEVNEELFAQGVEQVVNINTPMFQSDTEKLTAAQKEMLRAVSKGEKRLSAAAAKRRYSLGNPNTIARNKRLLAERGILELIDGTLTFVDPVYQLWVKGNG